MVDSMLAEEIARSIRTGLAAATDVDVQLDGNRAHIRVVSPTFADLNRVQKQQSVYGCISSFIADGRLHAVTIETHEA